MTHAPILAWNYAMLKPMCGRFAQTKNSLEWLPIYLFLLSTYDFEPNYNVTPTQTVQTIAVGKEGKPKQVEMTWGFSPLAHSEQPLPPQFNARSETVFEKPMFKTSAHSRRCLVPAEGYYEWRKEGSHKQCYFVQFPHQKSFAMAGIWQPRQTQNGVDLEVSILTTAANHVLSPYHHRMPIVVAPDDYSNWLNPNLSDPKKIKTTFIHTPEHVRVRAVEDPKRDQFPQVASIQTMGLFHE